MNILLINPPRRIFFSRSPVARWFPLGLACIATGVKKAGYGVEVFDSIPYCEDNRLLTGEEGLEIGLSSRPGVSAAFHLGASWERMGSYMEKSSPNVIGISAMMAAHRQEVLQTAKLARKIVPKAIIVVGGADASNEPDSYLKTELIDYVISGDGEESFPELLEKLAKNENVRNIKGICAAGDLFKSDDKIRYLGTGALDKLIPSYECFPMERWYRVSNMRFAMISTSRGCFNKCTFCSQGNIPFRARSIDSISKEIKQMIDKYDIDHLFFEDDMLLHNYKNSIELFEMIGNMKKRLYLHCLSGISSHLIDKSLAHIMKQAGLHTVVLGFETKQKSIRTKINKNFSTISELLRAIHLFKKEDVRDIRAFIIAGLPDTRVEDCLDDIGYILKQGARVNLNGYYPIGGTTLYEEVKQKEYIVSSHPSHFRSAYGNIDTQIFPRQHLLFLLDAYHGLKVLLEYTGFYECLHAFGISGVELKDITGTFLINVSQKIKKNVNSDNNSCCLHFANRLSIWFSIYSGDFYKGEELECGASSNPGFCMFKIFPWVEIPYEFQYIIQKLREYYFQYRRANERAMEFLGK